MTICSTLCVLHYLSFNIPHFMSTFTIHFPSIISYLFHTFSSFFQPLHSISHILETLSTHSQNLLLDHSFNSLFFLSTFTFNATTCSPDRTVIWSNIQSQVYIIIKLIIMDYLELMVCITTFFLSFSFSF